MLSPSDVPSSDAVSVTVQPAAAQGAITPAAGPRGPAWLAQLLNDQPPVLQPPLLALPTELALQVVTDRPLQPRDSFHITSTCRRLAAILPAGSRQAFLMEIVVARTPTGRHAHHLFELTHELLERKPAREQVFARLQRRLIDADAPGSLPQVESLSGAWNILADNAQRPDGLRFDFSLLEVFVAHHRLVGELHHDGLPPVNQYLAGAAIPFPIGPAARYVLEGELIDDNATRDELLDDGDRQRADHFSARWHIETPQGRERVEMVVCDPTMPAGELAHQRQRDPDDIADDYGVRPDEPDAPNRARTLLRDMYAAGQPIYT